MEKQFQLEIVSIMKILCPRLTLTIIALVIIPQIAQANSGDFDGAVAIGSSYAGVNTAPTNGLIVQGIVGIGTNVPLSGAIVTISGNTSALDAQTGFPLVIGGPDSGGSGILIDAFGTQAGVYAQRYDGTNASRTALASGDPILVFSAKGWNGSAMSASAGGIVLTADGAFTTTSTPTRFTVTTTQVGATTSAERMRITSSGNVGLGTTSPVNLLDISGGVAIGSSYAGTNTAPTNGLIVQGNVGIGTASPPGSVAIVGTTGNWSTYNYGKELIVTTTGGSNNPAIGISDYSGSNYWAIANSSGNLVFAQMPALSNSTSNPTNILALSSSGNVGIANTSPSYLLHVGSSSASGIVMELQNSSGACTYNPGASSVTVSCSSDMRLKSDIHDSGSALGWLEDMRVRDFTVKATGERKTGIVAQEIALTHPEMVHENAEGGYLVDEPNPWKIIKVLQEEHGLLRQEQSLILQQQNEIAELKQKIDQLTHQK